jgi:hypothetical protein
MQNRSSEYSSAPSGNVNKEVERLISEGKTTLTLQDYETLRRKYPNDSTLYEKVMEAFSERARDVRRTARKFYNLIMKNVLEGSTSGHTLYSILSLAKSYAKENGLSPAEMEEFRRLVETKLSSDVDEQPKEDKSLFPSPNVTSFSKLLGTVAVESNNGLQLKSSEYGVLDEIVKIYATTRTLHASVIIQSMLHQDCSAISLDGKYDPNRHNPAVHVNPLLFALFVPKFNSVDERMLLSNIANVVKAKYQKESIGTLPDYRLFYALVTDKNDVVCDSESPIKDLRNRVLLQQHLWSSVIAIRAGKYFDATASEFVNAIDNCKFSVYSPEVANMGDESMILKRLFAAFSFNPITVVSAPLYNSMNYDQYNSVGYTQEVYNVPYLQINVPPSAAISTPISINDVLNQTVYEFKNNTFVQRQRRIHSADEIVAVSLSRKFRTPKIPNNNALPFYAALPLTISGYETINQSKIDIPPSIPVGESNYQLRSAVFAEMILPVSLAGDGVPNAAGMEEVMVGTSAMVLCNSQWAAYRPVLIHAGGIYGNPNKPGGDSNSPIIKLPPAVDAEGLPDQDRDPMEILRRRGLVLFYKKVN